MKLNLFKFIFLFIIIGTALDIQAAPLCYDLFRTHLVQSVEIPNKKFSNLLQNLRSTISGKLATVWRSEWKTKLSIAESNYYVMDIINKFLSLESRQIILAGLDVNAEGFTRMVHARMYTLQENANKAGNVNPKDELFVRDRPAPLGANDTTFTYYTKPILTNQSKAKHQVRVRTYLREITYDKIAIATSVEGYDAKAGNLVKISRSGQDIYQVETFKNNTSSLHDNLSLSDMIKHYGLTLLLYAPHGKSFKLEIKSVLNDTISGRIFPRLAGHHMVQKLDVSLTPAQVAYLFAPLSGRDIKQKHQESLKRIHVLHQELLEKNPEAEFKARLEAVFNVLKQGISNNPDFLIIEGATAYHRTAFESKTRLQTTIDRDQGVTRTACIHRPH